MNHTPIISVIVPVYKAETYLSRCVDSLLAQTFKAFEVLLIDDGSPDRSGEICEQYALSDSRVKVFHQKNGGVSSARQYGLDNARGEYLIHADPDDWVEPTMLEELYSKAIEDNADMVMCDFWIYDKSDIYVSDNPCSKLSDDILKEMLNHKLHSYCWNKLVRSSLFKKYDICFPEDIIRWEDLWVTCSLLLHPISVSYLPKAFYHYDQTINQNSIVRKISRKGVQSQIFFCERMEGLLGPDSVSSQLYQCKAATKDLMYASGIYDIDEIVKVFEDINAQYISINSSLSLRNFRRFCLSLALSGRRKISSLLVSLYDFMLMTLSKLKHLLMKH